MPDDEPYDETNVGLDLCETEQSELARQYVLTQQLGTNEEWSHSGPKSISPFAPCASSRVPHILDAARLDSSSVLWDLGCGDGRVLHEAAARYGCRCVGVEIDKVCLEASEKRAEALGDLVTKNCSWLLKDITNLPVGSLGTDDAVAINTPSPTIVMLFVTGHGLCALSGWLKREWETAAKPFAVVTCVEALDTCVDLISIGGSNDGGGNPLFDQALNPHDWDVYRDTTHAKYGVFVTPPRGISVTEWRNQKVTPAPADPESAKKHAPRLVKNALDENDVSAIEALVEMLQPGFFDEASKDSNDSMDSKDSNDALNDSSRDDETLAMRLASALLGDDAGDAYATKKKQSIWSAAEDACHQHRTHRVVHLHQDDCLGKYAPRVRAKLLRCAFNADAAAGDADAASVTGTPCDSGTDLQTSQPWGLTRGRALFLRSAEYHAYENSGGVTDPDHRDTGSVITVSVLLKKPPGLGTSKEKCESGHLGSNPSGGVFFTRDTCDGGEAVTYETGEVIFTRADLARGDAIVFPSEKRHGVTALVGETSVRRSVVMELWEGGVTRRNRQE